MHLSRFATLTAGSAAAFLLAVPALAEDSLFADDRIEAVDIATIEQGRPQEERQGSPTGGPPPGIPGGEMVFDDTWVTLGIGAGLVPSYSGSDDYVVFPLPLIVGRVGGVGINPNGPGFALDLLSQPPGAGPPETSFSLGPAFRFRNDRESRIEDAIVELTEELDVALEVGVQGGVTFPGVLNRFDRLTLSTQVRWDILGAHDGMLVEPSVGYFTPLGRGAAIQLSGNLSFVDDDFADYYYTVTPQQSADSGLAQFTADGGLNSVGVLAILTVDLDNNVMNGGFNIYGIGGYSRLVGDAEDTPFTSERGSANQFIGGIGIGYTF